MKIRQLILIILSFSIINLIPFKSIFLYSGLFRFQIYVPYVNGIDFTDSNTGYAAGSYGKYIKRQIQEITGVMYSVMVQMLFWSTSFTKLRNRLGCRLRWHNYKTNSTARKLVAAEQQYSK